MNFERLKKSHLKRNIIIGIVAVLIISAVILNFTRAKYRVTESIPLVNGTINYTSYDFKMIAMYQENDNGDYVAIEKMPSSGYVINEEKSYCEINGEKDNNAKLATVNGNHTIANLQKGTKCYLYFDKSIPPRTMMEIVATYDKITRSSFSSAFSDVTTNTVYITTDWEGTSYYFAGAPTDNWVHFAGYYWRIIRINGDGSTRLIYNGTSTNTTGESTLIDSSHVFHAVYNRSYYVGLKYGSSQHGQNTDSDILTELDRWYNVISSNDKNYIDSNVGFCSDRDLNTSRTTSWSSTSTVYYATYGRLIDNKNPNLDCNSSDILRIPVGLITADEIVFAGGTHGGILNKGYYLYNNQAYWTLSPSHFDGINAIVFLEWFGYLSSDGVSGTYGIRPVINLKADTQFTGSGSIEDNDPFEA